MMNDFLTEDTKAIILLCGVFGNDRSQKPLSMTEYSSLVRWLIKVKIRPGDLLDKKHVTEAALESGIAKQRLESLLGRGVQLGFAVEEWESNGIWVLSRSDKDYPSRYKKHLKDKAPPLLFGVGDRSLLKGGGMGIVGSRNVDQAGQSFTHKISELCAYYRMPVVSGGARGVDQIAMTTALEADGCSIGILAENLLKKSLERSARHAISDGRLLLLSPYHPNARFSVGTAMGRNKLIYAMADYGLVVSADYQRGGTWAGATEELKRNHSLPVFVRIEKEMPPGNSKLVDLGAIPWPDSIDRKNFKQQLLDLAVKARENQAKHTPSLFESQTTQEEELIVDQPSARTPIPTGTSVLEPKSKPQESPVSVYQAVLPVILNKLGSPITPEELAGVLDVNKSQLDAWLKKAVAKNKVIKLTKPVRYQKVESGMKM